MKYSLFLESLNSFLNYYIIEEKGFSKNTQRSYKHSFKLLFEFFYTQQNIKMDKLSFGDLDFDNVTLFLDWLEKSRHCSPNTRNQRLAALRSFSDYSQINNIDAATTFRSAVIRIATKKFIPKELSFFTRDEVRYLLESTEDTFLGHRNRAILSFMYASGARAQEVCDLRVQDLRFDNERLKVLLHGKGNKVRQISISEKPAAILAMYLRESGKDSFPDTYVFSSRTNEHMKISCIEEIFKKHIASAKKSHPDAFKGKYSPHSMRHTTATHMLEAGVSIMVIKNFLGHSSVETTQMYAEITEKQFEQQTKKWNSQWLQVAQNHSEKYQIVPDFLL